MLTRLVGRAVRSLASKAGTSVLEATAELMVAAFEGAPQLQIIVARKVYRQSVHRMRGMYPDMFQPRVIDNAPMFTASNLNKCNDPGCDICRPRSGMAN